MQERKKSLRFIPQLRIRYYLVSTIFQVKKLKWTKKIHKKNFFPDFLTDDPILLTNNNFPIKTKVNKLYTYKFLREFP